MQKVASKVDAPGKLGRRKRCSRIDSDEEQQQQATTHKRQKQGRDEGPAGATGGAGGKQARGEKLRQLPPKRIYSHQDSCGREQRGGLLR